MMFSERPVIPLAILMHDTKRDPSHTRFVQILSKELPQLHEKCVLVTDCEDALNTAFRTYHPAMLQFRFWNHASANVKAAIKKYFLRYPTVAHLVNETDHQTKRDVVANVIDSITNLLRAPTATDYLAEYENISTSWPVAFRDYLETNIMAKIDELSELKRIFSEMSTVDLVEHHFLHFCLKITRRILWMKFADPSFAVRFSVLRRADLSFGKKEDIALAEIYSILISFPFFFRWMGKQTTQSL